MTRTHSISALINSYEFVSGCQIIGAGVIDDGPVRFLPIDDLKPLIKASAIGNSALLPPCVLSF